MYLLVSSPYWTTIFVSEIHRLQMFFTHCWRLCAEHIYSVLWSRKL